MSYLLRSPPASYAYERLNHSLTALSTVPIVPPPAIASEQQDAEHEAGSDHVRSALKELAGSRPITRSKLEEVLQELVVQGAAASPVDDVLLTQVTARAVTVLWREVLEIAVDAASDLERERIWWEEVVGSRRQIIVYFVQSLPLRLFALLPKPLLPLHLRLSSIRLTSLFRHRSSRDLPLPGNPLTLTRREIISTLRALKTRRDNVAEKIGFLASHAPKWDEIANRQSAQDEAAGNLETIAGETTRIYALLCVILELPLPIPGGSATMSGAPSSANSTPRKRASPTTSSSLAARTPPNVSTLLPILRESLGSLSTSLREPLRSHSRPSRLTRLWLPALLLPPLAVWASRSVKGNQQWIREQARNAGETIRGFFVGWVWEPIEGVIDTLRGGGEGLGVAPETVKSDKASLERMVLDLGRDYYHLDDAGLVALKKRVNKGDMDDVLKVYEGEMRSPVKNAVMGSLVRTLLIQVQKTKTDLSLSLLSLDHLLKSQQLTFAFVGLAPSLLVLYGLGGWLRGVWTGEKRGKSRRQAYATALRDVERLVLTSSRDGETVGDRDRGLLLLSVGRMRQWAGGLAGASREDLLDDLRLIEDTGLARTDKLCVVQRIWRGWGHDGRRAPRR